MVNGKQKGAAGERELAKFLNSYGYKCRRSQQYCGANGDADVIGLPGVHIECKRVERLNLYEALEQSMRDAKDGNVPVVMHRRNNHKWLATMELKDWLKIYQEYESAEYLQENKDVKK